MSSAQGQSSWADRGSWGSGQAETALEKKVKAVLTGDSSGRPRCGRLLPSGTTWWQLSASPRMAGTPAENAAGQAAAITAQQESKPILFLPRT